MRDQAAGRLVRLLRHRRRFRQVDLAARAGVSQQLVSTIERGRFDRTSLQAVRAVVRALDGDVEVLVRWRGAEIDRLADEAHASLVGETMRLLASLDWIAVAEVTYSRYGERGSIDVLGWHDATRTLLVVEVKSELASVEATLRRHDEKVRLGPVVARERFDWQAESAARLLVVRADSTSRRRVARHGSILEAAYPARGRAVGAWLRAPRGSVAGLWFLSATPGESGSRHRVTRRRVREPGARTGGAAGSSGGRSRPAQHSPGE